MSISSLRSAVAFLTVIPIAAEEGKPGERLGRAYFPAVGALVGVLAGVAFALTAALTTPLLGAVAAIATLAALTGGLHLDGVADAADGLFGRGDLPRRLEMMRDPRVGSFGVTALGVVLLGDLAALAGMSPSRAIVALVISGALSRLAMLFVVAFVPYVRDAGLGVAAAGANRTFDVVLGSALAAIACLLDWRRALVAILIVAVAGLLLSVLARRRIGGATGDIYGAVAEACQLAALLTFAVRV